MEAAADRVEYSKRPASARAALFKRWLYGNQNVTKNSPVVCDGYAKYEKTELDRSAIMPVEKQEA